MSGEFPAIERALMLMRARLRPSENEQELSRRLEGRLTRLAELARSRASLLFPASAKRSPGTSAAPNRDCDLKRWGFRALVRHAERRSAARRGLAEAGQQLRQLLRIRFSRAVCEQCVRRKGAGRLAELYRVCRQKQGAMLALLAAVLAARI